ncbi:MAG TPA: hypothetical protein VFA82_09610 [Gaiellaceae bacterium]|nr:hypothetical protein [Gaiellaceae bacterium]
MAKRVLLLPLLALVLFAAAGCAGSGGGSGGGGGSSADAASLVPADALAYATIDTDLGSDELKSAQQVLGKFPIESTALARVMSAAAKQGVDLRKLSSSVGPVLDVALLKTGAGAGAVGFARPSDEQAFDAQLGKLVHTTVSGWTVFAKTQALLDAVTSKTAALADDATYKEALASLPGTGDAIARAYAPASSLKSLGGSSPASTIQPFAGAARWFTGALTSKDGTSFKLEAHVKTSAGGSSSGGTGLADEIPSGAIAALSLTGGSFTLPAAAQAQLGTLTQSAGVDVQGLLGLLRGPVIAYVKPGAPIPAVTLAAKPPDPAGAEQAITSLLAKALASQTNGAAPQTTTVDGVQLQTLSLGPVALYWGRVGDQIAVTDDTTSISAIKSGAASGKLADDSLFKDAVKGSGMPDSNQGFLYVDAKDALPLVEGFATLASQTIPPQLQSNLAPLASALVYGARSGDVEDFVVYVSTN